MASPFVAGLAALIKAVETNQRSNEALENLIENTSDDIDDLNPDIDLGEGRIDMASALDGFPGGAAVEIKKAIYRTKRQKLNVTASSSAGPTDVLTVEGFGTMVYKPSKKKFILNLKPVSPMPTQVTVSSAILGISETVNVTTK
jgi:hypothetical protein